MGCCGWPRSDWTPTKVIDRAERDRMIAERYHPAEAAGPAPTPGVED